jgi:hypothetical protein
MVNSSCCRPPSHAAVGNGNITAPLGCFLAPPPATGACCGPAHTLRLCESSCLNKRCAGRLAGAGPSCRMRSVRCQPEQCAHVLSPPVLPVICRPSQCSVGGVCHV